MNAAFRKRQKDKMKLRKKAKFEIKSYFRMVDLRKNQVCVLGVLQQVFLREQVKRKLNQVS